MFRNGLAIAHNLSLRYVGGQPKERDYCTYRYITVCFTRLIVDTVHRHSFLLEVLVATDNWRAADDYLITVK